jgi:hypothetical protein
MMLVAYDCGHVKIFVTVKETITDSKTFNDELAPSYPQNIQ